MPPRSNPTARQSRLGSELRKMRERAGMTAREAAALLGSNHMQLSHQEAGRSGISEARLRRLAGFYSCDDDALIDALVAMANERSKGWWEEYRGTLTPGFLDLAELDRHATFMRTFHISHIPGLFQTKDYIRAVFDYTVPRLSDADREAHIEYRLRRQTVIAPGTGVPHRVIIHEAALRMRFGGPKVAHVQLDRILEVSEQEHITVLVVPYAADGFAGSGSPITYAGGPVPQLDTVQLDAVHGILFVDAESQLKMYRDLLDRMERMSLPVEESRAFIHRITQEA
jgi:transcriptional regulator with XRE-family HTH domain